MIYFSAAKGRTINSCNTNYIQNGMKHPDRILDEYDFLYIKNGTWNIWEDNISYSLKAKHLLVLEPGKHHYSIEKCSPGMRNMYIHCSYMPQDCLHQTQAEPENTKDFFKLQKLTDCTDNPQIEYMILQLIETYWSKCPHYNLILEAQFFLLLAEIENSGEKTFCNDSIISNIIRQFYLYPGHFFSLQELAGRYNISVRSLSGRFKKSTGTSVHRYQMNLKLDFANEQIALYPERRLKDIALDLGFYDEFQFSRLFKRKFGYTPSSKRR